MTSVLRLGIHGGIPVRVVEDDGVGAGKVDSHSAGTSRQNEAENTTVIVESEEAEGRNGENSERREEGERREGGETRAIEKMKG